MSSATPRPGRVAIPPAHPRGMGGLAQGAASTEGTDMAKAPEVGTTATDFTLPGVLLTGGTAERGDYTLTAQRGEPVVLAFYPGDNTSVCTKQLCSYTAGLRRSVFVIDSDGILRWKHVTLVGLTFPKAATITAQLAALAS